MKRTIAWMLALLMAASVLISCGNKTEDPAVTTGGATEQVTSATTTEATTEVTTENPYDEAGYLKSSLPEDLNFGGQKVTILWWNDTEKPEFIAEQINGELINDAIYQRNSNVQEKLGVTFEWDGTKGMYNAGVGAAYVQYVGNNFNAGDSAWDVMAAHSRTMAMTAMYGYCTDLMALDYLDFEKPWWPTVMTETATIGDRMYFVTGDASTNSIHMMYCLFYNKDILSQHKLQDPTELVKAGKWTNERMVEMSKDIYQDLNASGAKDKGDVFGFTTKYWHIDAIYFGSGMKQCDPDPEKLVKISDDYFSEKAINLSDYLGAWAQTNDVNTDSGHYRSTFTNGNALFILARHSDVADYLGDVNFSYGILPVPKYDEYQDIYITAVGNPVSFYSVYANSKDPNCAAAVLECWAAEAYRTTTPAVFEMTMKLKYSDSSTEAEMYDLIRAGIIFDLGRLFNNDLSTMSHNWDNSIVNNTSWQTLCATYKKVLPKQLEQIVKAFVDLTKQ